jgi:hypothetical protein
MDPGYPIRRWLLLSICTAVFFTLCMLAQTMQRGSTRSPHGQLSIPCASCHTSISWKPLRAIPEFNHNRETKYPLRGMHAKVECSLCHTNPVFKQVGTTCAACHADIHRRQLGANCESCHTVKGWQLGVQSVREHSARFPLLGAHAATDCESCHRGAAAAQYTGVSTQCGSCHIKDYDSAKSINHLTAGFPVQCEMCHNSDSWLGVKFDHSRFGAFALVGVHAQLDCVSCHVGNRFKGTPVDCYSCHVKDFTAATNPNHITAQFPTNCSLCHTSDTWLNARFDHSTSGFPLTGAHVSVACAQCHVNNQFAGTATQCAACHMDAFNQTTTPNHAAAGFPTDCSVCHSTSSWQGGVFDHSKTKFPLTGAHVPLACTQCHANGQFTTLSTTCASCHTSTSWAGASFTHNQFPIYSGTHAGRWTSCGDCHTNVSNYQIVSCTNCHTHDQASTDPHHRGVRGYVYAPTSCYSCHSTGGRGRG